MEWRFSSEGILRGRAASSTSADGIQPLAFHWALSILYSYVPVMAAPRKDMMSHPAENC